MILLSFIILFAICNSNLIFRKDKINEDYISLENSNAVRGIMAWAVVITHLSASLNRSNVLILKGAENIGYLAVAMFFFLSGYGLLLGKKTKNNYMNFFLNKRLPAVLIPCFLVILIFLPVRILVFGKEALASQIEAIITLEFNWYVTELVFFYLIFYLTAKLIKNSDKKFLVVCSLLCIVLTYILLFVKGKMWAISSYGFILGMVWAEYKETITDFFKKHYYPLFFVISISAIAFYLFTYMFIKQYVPYGLLFIVIYQISAILFCLFLIMLMMRVKFKGRVLAFFGGISYEIYLVHNFYIAVLRGYMSNDLLYVASVMVATLITAYVFHFVFAKVLSAYKKIIK